MGCFGYRKSEDKAYPRAVNRINGIIDNTIQKAMTSYSLDWNRVKYYISQLIKCYRNGDASSELYDTTEAAVAYLCCYAPRYMRALLDILLQLTYCGLVPPAPRILDIGAGCGTSNLAVAALFDIVAQRLKIIGNMGSTVFKPQTRLAAEIVAVDISSPNLSVNRQVAASLDSIPFLSLGISYHEYDLRVPHDLARLASLGSFDIIIISNVLNELRSLSDQKRLLQQVGNQLDEKGTIIVLEPASEFRSDCGTFRRACYEVASEGYLKVVGPCYMDCNAFSSCWTFSRGNMSWSDYIAENIDIPPALMEYRYSNIILRKDSLMARSCAKNRCRLSEHVGEPHLDIEALVAAYLPVWGGCYKLCDGFSGSELIWLRNTTKATQSLEVGKVYRIRSARAVWESPQTANKANRQHFLTLIGDESTIEPVACTNQTVKPEMRFYYAILGSPLLVCSSKSNSCRGNWNLWIEGEQREREFIMGNCFDHLLLRRFETIHAVW